VEAQPINHTEALEVPTRSSRSEQEDEYVIMLLFPDGTGLEALGSYSGVRSKAVSQPQVRRRLRAAASSNLGISSAKSARPKAAVAPDTAFKIPPRTISSGADNKRKIRRPDGRIGNTPNQGAGSTSNLPGVGPIPGPPEITGAGLQPEKSIGSVNGKLAPAGTVVIFGKNFGTQQGSVSLRVDLTHIPEYPGGVPFQIMSWSDTTVKAKIPSPMTGPIFSVDVAIRLSRVNPAKTIESMKAFQVPVDKRILRRTDYEKVQLIHCGTPPGNDGQDSWQGDFDKTISGHHRRNWDATPMEDITTSSPSI